MIRAAHIRTSSGETSRPITKLYPLEISAREQQAEKTVQCSTDSKHQARSTVPGELRIEHVGLYLSGLRCCSPGSVKKLE